MRRRITYWAVCHSKLCKSLAARWLSGIPGLALADSHFVSVPLGDLTTLYGALPRPDVAAFLKPTVWVAAATIAIVASIETLLSLQAIDRLDPLKRHSPPDRELLAQGVANSISGLLGGLPVTAVIVRSGANVAAGHLKQKLGIGFGETTPDGFFTLKEGECMGACAMAPVVLVNNKRMCDFMSKAKLDALIDELSKKV